MTRRQLESRIRGLRASVRRLLALHGLSWVVGLIVPLAILAIERWDKRLGRAWAKLHWRLVGRRQLVCRAIALALSRPGLTRLGFEFCTRAPGAAGLILKRLNAPSFLTNVS